MNDQKLVFLTCLACGGRPIPRKMLWELKRDHGVTNPESFVCQSCSSKNIRSKADFEAASARKAQQMIDAGYERCECGEWCHHSEQQIGFGLLEEPFV